MSKITHEQAERICLLRTGDAENDCVMHGSGHRASLGALLCGAVGGDNPEDVAESALEQLADELFMLAYSVREGSAFQLNKEIVANVIHGMSERARVAAAVADKVRAAKRSEQAMPSRQEAAS